MSKIRCQRRRNSDTQAGGSLRGAVPAHSRPSASPAVAGNQAAQRLLRQPGPGQPLSDSGRRFFEPRFGQSFEHVRVHNDSGANQSARALHARAFTAGNDIVFANQQYAPETQQGKSLLAHELAHTIQQQTPSTPSVQRTIGDGHDLTSPRFAGDPVLEAVYDNERLLQTGNNGAAVRKLQQALVDSGFPLPRFGVDGKFGSETEGAVRDLQRTSGLIGTDRDGIVGPTTMGWLDQRFSAGPTPAGTTHGATTGCASIRTINVDIVSLDGSTRNPFADLEFANAVLNQCCVRFAFGGGGSEDPVRTRALIGGDTDLSDLTTTNCATPSVEETGLFAGASADFGLSNSIRIFYVASLTSGSRAYSIPAFCGTGASAGLRGMAAVSNSGQQRSLAHELGHILLNSPTHPADTNNLMNPTNTATGEQLTAAQCSTI
jgi:peptidoglycan hydrolase-like protein with peptidoglycan-binding domain